MVNVDASRPSANPPPRTVAVDGLDVLLLTTDPSTRQPQAATTEGEAFVARTNVTVWDMLIERMEELRLSEEGGEIVQTVVDWYRVWMEAVGAEGTMDNAKEVALMEDEVKGKGKEKNENRKITGDQESNSDFKGVFNQLSEVEDGKHNINSDDIGATQRAFLHPYRDVGCHSPKAYDGGDDHEEQHNIENTLSQELSLSQGAGFYGWGSVGHSDVDEEWDVIYGADIGHDWDLLPEAEGWRLRRAEKKS
ncbi:hypothetical protein B0O99DRAFT_384873 [Bisporella sp. PMI_857]|nr:hypothetical protein B0O99DRAFT_384873 [Bisporella sp. PMI_857]